MKKKLLIALCIMLVLTAIWGIQTAFAGNDDYDIVRVKISIGTPSQFLFFIDGNYSVNGVGLDRQLYTVKLQSGTLNLYYGTRLIFSGASIRLVQHAPASGRNNFIWMHNTNANNDYRYIGDMEFRIDSGNACVMAVNHLYIEDYLCGVVPYEMSNSWPIEALKAQAVAARCYVIKKMGGSGAYDVVDTSDDQVFRGYDASLQRSIDAVNATSKQVLTSGGSIIETYYSASNGGWTELPYHRWGGGAGWQYYIIQQDPFDAANPSSPYETIFLPTVNTEAGAAFSDNFSSTNPNPAQAVIYIKQEIVNSGQLAPYGVSSVYDFSLIGISELYTHTYDVTGSQDHSLMPWNGVNDCVDKVMASGDFTVSVNGTPYSVWDVNLDLRYLNGRTGGDMYRAFGSTSLGIFLIEPVYSGETLTGFNLSQKRYGHGIGLSQRGAQQRASSGQLYQEILGFYYPSTALTALTYNAPALTPIVPWDSSNASVVLTDPTPLKVRSGPTTSSVQVGSLPNGARINVVQANVAQANGHMWHQILYGGEYRYVAATYVQMDPSDSSIRYQTHVQDIGWQDWKNGYQTSGTSGQSLRLEAIRIQLNGVDGGIEYKTHVQDIGWQNWVGNGAVSGTSGQSLRLEAIQIRLTGQAANVYDLYYRVHAQNIGWMDWTKNGGAAGTAGFSYRLEAIQIAMVPKGNAPPGATSQPFAQMGTVSYQSHVQDIGWQNRVGNGAVSGTSGQSLRLEAMRIQLNGIDGGIEYKTHVQNIGWMNWVSNDQLSGTEGQSLRLEAIQIRLTGTAAQLCDIYYRVHAQDFGWMGWAKNGQSAGTAGFSYRLEAIQIMLVPKDSAAPGNTANGFVQK